MQVEPLAYSSSSDSLIVRALCRDLIAQGVNLDISSADEMLQFFVHVQGHTLEQAVAMYLESGRRIWRTERQVIAWRFGSPFSGTVLDFASGYGRVTRHIVMDVPKERVWVADIYADGVAFQERELGVHGLVSTTAPEDFQCDRLFDCILVSSLFTHLPRESFRGWLRRLGALLAPGGLLLFSVHDMPLLARVEPENAAADFVFREQSESGSLSTQDYGTSWVSESFARRAAQEAVGPYPVARIPRGLASFQDLYILVKDSTASPSIFSDLKIKREADGFLEHCSWTGERGLRLSGWAADRVTGNPPCEIRVRIDGSLVASCRDLQPRPSMSKAFAADPMDVVGWQTAIALPEGSAPESARLGVWAVSCEGEELGLYEGPAGWACLRSAQLDAAMLVTRLQEQEAAWAGRLEQLRAQCEASLAGKDALIHAMRASRFWKARNIWFAFKRAIGVTDER